jgi:hypothetical protein
MYVTYIHRQNKEHKVDTYVYQPRQILEEHVYVLRPHQGMD